MPPGSAKSFYISVSFPPWFLAQQPNQCILACSYAKDLIQGFGRDARNLILSHGEILGYSIAPWSKAADDWQTTNGGRYFCAGLTAGIAGHRADVGFIDDPIGKEEDAGSLDFRDKLWSSFWNDFMPRLKPGGSVIIVANRRHEDDLVGRLISRYPNDWELIKMPLVIETPEQEASDRLGRKIGDRLWPEWFDEQFVADARKSPMFSGLHQQDPSPPGGELIKSEWITPYHQPDQVPKNLRIYVGSDHALTEKASNDMNCLIPVGVDSSDNIWILPDVWWKRSDTGDLVEAMLDMGQRRQPVNWFAENEHINKAIGPFLRKRMTERNVFFPITGLTSSRDLVARSTSIRGRMQNGKVFFPSFTTWFNSAKHEMLSFPKGIHDDFVAALAEIGRGLDSMTKGSPEHIGPTVPRRVAPTVFSLEWLKASDARNRSRLCARYNDH
jgi:predicted phage terminase large subunit-like protein